MIITQQYRDSVAQFSWWTRRLLFIIPCLCICICICLPLCLFLAVSQFSKMINLRCAALYALFLAQGQAGLYQAVLISTQCILIFSNFTISKIPSMHCFLRKGKLGCCVPWSFNQHTMYLHDEVEKGRSCSSGNRCDMVYIFTCKEQCVTSISH